MEPSSLVFVAIIGVWAAYLVPHWMRRRTELTESRTEDRHSDGLRLLRRRRPRGTSALRSGDAVLTSPRLVVDSDGEFLYIPADRALAARLAASAAASPSASTGGGASVEVGSSVEVDSAAAAGPSLGAEAMVEAEATPGPEAMVGGAAPGDVMRAGQATSPEPAVGPEPVASPEPAVGPEPAGTVSFAALLSNTAEAVSPLESSDPEDSPVLPGSAEPVEAEPDTVATSSTSSDAPVPFDELATLEDLSHDLDAAMLVARTAARRRARIMAVLLLATLASWGVSIITKASIGIALPATVLLALDLLASRVAGLRSREAIDVLAAHVHAAELAEAREQRRTEVAARTRAAKDAAVAAAIVPERVARRAQAVGAETWDPVPVPPPTYTLKPAVHRPEPAPLDLPAAPAAAAAGSAAPAASAGSGTDRDRSGVSRGKLPRRAADIERILALESDVDRLFEDRKAVNG